MAKTRRKPKKASPTGRVKTLREVARVFGVSYVTVRGSWRGDSMPGRRGHWDLAKIAAWKRNRLRDPENIGSNTNGQIKKGDYVARRRAAEARIKEADASKRERENERAKGNTMDRVDVERFFSQFFTQVRDLLMRVPEEMKGSFPRKQREELTNELRKRHELILMTLHGWRPRLQDSGESEP